MELWYVFIAGPIRMFGGATLKNKTYSILLYIHRLKVVQV